MSYKEFVEDIKKNNLRNIYLCFGKESYLKNWAVNTIKNKYIDASFESLNFVLIDAAKTTIKEVINASETLPFMSDKKIVIVENPPYFNGNSDDKKNEEDMIRYLNNPSETTCLVFILNENKPDSRKKIVKLIKKNGLIIEFEKLKGEDLNKWINKKFKEYKKKIDTKVIYHIVESSGYLENNNNKTLYDLENEIIKITNYVGNRDVVNNEDVDKVIIKSLQNNIFKLVDGIGQKDKGASLTILNEMLLENEPIQIIIFMIIRQFRLLLMAKLLEGKGYSQGTVAKKMKVPNFVAKKIISQSKNFSKQDLKSALDSCLKVDKISKTSTMDNKLALEMLLVNL